MLNTFTRWFGKAYDAVNTTQRRRTLVVDTRSEDALLQPLDRDKLISNARSLRRNHAIVAYAVRKHLDYVSTFTFQSNTPRRKPEDPEIDALNKLVEAKFAWWSRPENCDISGRYDLQRLIRMFESLAVTEGDAFFYTVSSGKVQIIEGDRVRNPTDLGEYANDGIDFSGWTHGVKTADSGKALRYAVCDRTGGQIGFVLRELVQPQYMIQHTGYMDRYDQIRGISPLSSAMNNYFDLYEAAEYALGKMKLSQLFAVKHTQKGTEGEGNEQEPLKLDWGSGPIKADLGEGEDLSFLESQTPSVEFQSFYTTGIQVGLKALDIPYSIFDESHTNYSGARQALQQYEQSADAKRGVLQRVLGRLWTWRLMLMIADGEIVLPDGVTLDDLKWDFIPAGLPWIDPLKEVTADTMAVKASFRSRQMICKEQGNDFFTVADQIAAENEYLKSKGLGTDVENVTVALDALLNAPDTKAA